VKRSLTSCLEAGYALFHIDATVDRLLRLDQPIPIELVVERTVELVEYCERERRNCDLPPVAYEVGTEEVHGGLVDLDAFDRFVQGLRRALAVRDLLDAWPCFIVGKVGTDLHTTHFDANVARLLYELVSPLGSLPKGHYTDWVANPEAYPESGMGGANVGPEFTSEEYLALEELASREVDLLRDHRGRSASRVMEAVESAVAESNRWQKWLRPEERGMALGDLSPERRSWLVQTGARYVWTDRRVLEARQQLYLNLSGVMADPHQFVVDRIARAMDRYITRFHLFGSLGLLTGQSGFHKH
jgi:tagatose-1,6-bisphosphate aldolase non-catalytic subunit AgaZ/GatZ